MRLSPGSPLQSRLRQQWGSTRMRHNSLTLLVATTAPHCCRSRMLRQDRPPWMHWIWTRLPWQQVSLQQNWRLSSPEQFTSAALLMPAVLSAGEVQEKRSVHGHMQPYILENATEACTEPTREKFETYIQQLRQLVEVRRTDLKTIHTASCLHRLSRAALSLSNVSILPICSNIVLWSSCCCKQGMSPC